MDNSRIANSRTGQVADWTTRGLADAAKRTKTKHAKSPVASARCPVRESSSPRVGNPRVSVSASCPVTPRDPCTHRRLVITVREILGKCSYALDVVAEPLSADYFDQLSADIGDDWLRLADKLKLGRAAVQRISLMSNARHGNAAQRSARDALVQWFRSSAKSHNRVRKLV